MIMLNCGATKWRKSFIFQPTTCAWIYIGHDTYEKRFPSIPRFPLVPDVGIPKVWLEYFRQMHDILSDHISDLQRHRAK